MYRHILFFLHYTIDGKQTKNLYLFRKHAAAIIVFPLRNNKILRFPILLENRITTVVDFFFFFFEAILSLLCLNSFFFFYRNIPNALST